jgi:surface polysaccharide O-acyltransferase-like enzyme
MEKERLIGPDILRALAVICVIGGHFFALNTPFNDTPFIGCSMFFQGCLKSFMQGFGVPMFLMLSGYFCCRKEFTIKYYRGITKVLYTYVFISIVTWLVLSESYSIKDLIFGITGFSMVGYAWYIEMYLGLFLLIPFINMALDKAFGNKTIAISLILILTLLCSLPTTIDRGSIKLIPNYWQACYPVLCYCIGAYIRKFQPLFKRKRIAMIIAVCITALSPCILLCYNMLTGGVKRTFLYLVPIIP